MRFEDPYPCVIHTLSLPLHLRFSLGTITSFCNWVRYRSVNRAVVAKGISEEMATTVWRGFHFPMPFVVPTPKAGTAKNHVDYLSRRISLITEWLPFVSIALIPRTGNCGWPSSKIPTTFHLLVYASSRRAFYNMSCLKCQYSISLFIRPFFIRPL